MADNTKLDCLKALQDVLKTKFDLERQVEALPANLREEESKLKEYNEEYLRLTEKFNSVNEEYKSLAIKYDDAFATRTNYEKQMEYINTQREFEALTKQMDEARVQEQTLLKSRNLKNNELQKLEAELSNQEKLCAEQKAKVDGEMANVESDIAALKEDIAKLDKQCLAIKGNVISDELYNKFTNITKQKNSIGIVPVWGQVCQGCNMVLPMQFVIDLRLKQEKNELDYCPYCSRLIYFEKLDPETEKNYIFEQLEPTKESGKSSSKEPKQDVDVFDESMELEDGFEDL